MIEKPAPQDLCPICNCKNIANYLKSKDYRLKKKVGGNIEIHLRRCNECEHIWQFPYPNEVDIPEFYDEEFYNNKKNYLNRLLNNFQYSRLKRLIEKFFNNKKIKLLDFGAGQGQLMRYLTDNGYEVDGTEISKSGIDIGEKVFGLRIIGDPLNYLNNANTSYDLVIASHVIEHLVDPYKYMVLINKLIKKGGCIALEVPNINSWESKIFRDKYIHLDVPRHIHHFSNKSLSILLKKTGFHCQDSSGIYTLQFPLSGIQSIVNYLKFKNKYNFLIFISMILIAPFYLILSILINAFHPEKICIGGIFSKV
jgi:2-polyprenyl-3-methyl-5-hydroxy-6-metoxy-1,4-benzoquinol methylase